LYLKGENLLHLNNIVNPQNETYATI